MQILRTIFMQVEFKSVICVQILDVIIDIIRIFCIISFKGFIASGTILDISLCSWWHPVIYATGLREIHFSTCLCLQYQYIDEKHRSGERQSRVLVI